jgi:hypothetical protein
MTPPPVAAELAAPLSPSPRAPVDLPPTEDLLVAGGDARLVLDGETGLNKYACGPLPDAELAAFGSSTASIVSERGFAAAAALRGRLARAGGVERSHVTYARELQRIRGELARLCDLTSLPGLEMLFAASGTDLHLLAGQLAAAGGDDVSAIMVEATETGSGVPAALAGRHFSSCTALGDRVVNGAPLLGSHGVDVVSIPAREADGSVRAVAEVTDDLEQAVEAAVRAGRRVLLTVVDVSKTGLLSPSLDCVLGLRRRWGAALDVLVDGCQFRLAPATLRAYLRNGFMVALTGSKFLTGPAFAGVLMVPESMALRLYGRELPRALRAYSSRGEWPRGWGAARGLPETANFGLLLRWEATLAELRAFRALSETAVETVVAEFGQAVQRRLGEDPHFTPVVEPPVDRRPFVETISWDRLPTIFPFLLRRASGSRAYLSRSETERVYKALAIAVDDGTAIGALRAHVGQPVACGERQGTPVSALRLCLSARLIVEAVADHRQAAVLDRAHAVLDKAAALIDGLES